MLGKHSHYPNWNPCDDRRGRTPFHKFLDRVQKLREGPARPKAKYTGHSNVDDWESGDWDGELRHAEKRVGKVVLKPDQSQVVYHAQVGDPNYAHSEDLQFRRQEYAAKKDETPISFQGALAKAKQLEGKFEEQRQQAAATQIENKVHAQLCADLAKQLKDVANRMVGVNKLKQAEAVVELNREMRKFIGILGRLTSDGSNTIKGQTNISLEAHHRVMRDLCRKAIGLLEYVYRIEGNLQ
jgi:hypothetical protein